MLAKSKPLISGSDGIGSCGNSLTTVICCNSWVPGWTNWRYSLINCCKSSGTPVFAADTKRFCRGIKPVDTTGCAGALISNGLIDIGSYFSLTGTPILT